MSSPLRKFESPIQDFLATVLFFKPHNFPHDSLVAFDSYQSEKVRNSRIVNLTVTTIWVHFTWSVLLMYVRFYNRGKRVATWSSRCAKVFMPPRILYGSQVQCVCLFCLTQIRKNRCDSYKKRRPCVLSNISITAISVGLPVAVNNPVLASQIGFQQFRARFCVEGSNKRSVVVKINPNMLVQQDNDIWKKKTPLSLRKELKENIHVVWNKHLMITRTKCVNKLLNLRGVWTCEPLWPKLLRHNSRRQRDSVDRK